MATEDKPSQMGERQCPRCKAERATLEVRAEPVCPACFCAFVRVKTAKRVEALDRGSRNSIRQGTVRYLVGLSFGPSSSVMVQILDELDENFVKKRRPVLRKFHIVHVDTESVLFTATATASTAAPPPPPSRAAALLERWRAAYPRFAFECVSLAAAAGLSSIDWSALPPLRPGCPPEEQVRGLLESLPSLTSRADVTRLLVRHVLMSVAASSGSCALMLGHNTTSLAALTLSETAKGRGFSLPWFTNDGPQPIVDYRSSAGADGGADHHVAQVQTSLTAHHPLRELYRKELDIFAELTGMDERLTVRDGAATNGVVVSHRDLGIDDVMTRYFQEVEQSYPSIVANVVRTTAKLTREDGLQRCGLCGLAVDETGNERWRGEMGDDKPISGGGPEGAQAVAGSGRLCYGCERTVYG